MELLGADGSVCQAAWGNVVPFHGRLKGLWTLGRVPKWDWLGEAAVQPASTCGGNEWDSEDVTLSDSEDGED